MTKKLKNFRRGLVSIYIICDKMKRMVIIGEHREGR